MRCCYSHCCYQLKTLYVHVVRNINNLVNSTKSQLSYFPFHFQDIRCQFYHFGYKGHDDEASVLTRKKTMRNPPFLMFGFRREKVDLVINIPEGSNRGEEEVASGY